MDKSRKDIFETTTENRIASTNDNFFLFDDSSNITIPKASLRESTRRLNDYDFNLLKEDAYKDVSDDLFKLEYKISRIEEEIKNLESQIESAREIGDYDMIKTLSTKKTLLEEDFEALIAIYNDKSISAKISDKILNLFDGKLKNNLKNIHTKFSNFSEKIIDKMPRQLSSIFELKKTLAKLENLNRSVDELMSLNIPYGENINKYEQLSKYIIKANSIQAEISRYIKNK
jgi:hypothetical protein